MKPTGGAFIKTEYSADFQGTNDECIAELSAYAHFNRPCLERNEVRDNQVLAIARRVCGGI